MAGNFANESMLDMYIFETNQQVERLEQPVINGDSTSKIHEIKEFLSLLKDGNGSDECVKVTKKNSKKFFVSSDKNIIEHILAPLMNLVRNSIDYNMTCCCQVTIDILTL